MTTNEQKKILYVITKSNWGGAQRYVYDMSTNVSQKPGFNVSVALGGDGVLKDRLVTENIPVISLTSLQRDVHLLNDVKVFFELLRVFREEKPDVIHLNSSKIGIVGALAGRIYNLQPTNYNLQTNIIFTAHGWAHTEDRPWYQKMVIKFLHWLTIVLCHTTIAVSEQTKKELADTPFTKNKLVVVYNGVVEPDLIERSQARNTLTPKSLPEDALVLGTIAELHPNKGLTYAIEAFEQVLKTTPNLFFIIIGAGQEKDRIHNLVQEKNLRDNILFYESNEANRYLSAYDMFILPSIKEGLPYTILEAGCARLPVIASNVGGIPEILENNVNGILTAPRNVSEIQHAVATLARDERLREKLGMALYSNVKTQFSTQTMVDNTIAYYNKNINKETL